MAVSSYYATTFFLIFVIALGVAGGQKNHLSAEDNKVLRNDYVSLNIIITVFIIKYPKNYTKGNSQGPI
jgi:hypothetical protein